LNDLGEDLERVAGERLGAGLGALDHVFDGSRQLLEDSREFLDGSPRLLVRGCLEIDLGSAIVEEDRRRRLGCETSVSRGVALRARRRAGLVRIGPGRRSH